ncbi:MAG: DNA translocase FtsK, partial [Candidatus Sumerlaeia bacterium]|nr:DNA translocase FtsK [Candidatus Sumerlaeia bacterium]
GITGDDESGEEQPRRSGLFSGLFRARSASVLNDPDHDEIEESDIDLYDEDAQAASHALEEARIDEEYERALAEEARLAAEAEADEDEEDEGPRITYHDDGQGELDFLKGNPADEAEVDGDDEDLENPNMGGALAKLFPSRWEEGDEGVVRRDPKAPKDKSADEILDAAEGRALRRTLEKSVSDEDSDEDGPAFSAWNDDLASDEQWNPEGDDDPLFNGDLDTRPAGPLAAMKAASVSAMEPEETDAERRGRILAEYRLPDIQLLDDPPRVDHRMSREEMLEISQTLEKTFNDFNIQVKVTEVKQGPVVTRFELKPAPGIKVSKIVGLEHDIALAMKAESVRIVAPIPGKAAVGIEVPNKKRSGVYFKELVAGPEFWDHPSPLGFALGKTIDGQPYYADLKKMPHLLIAGATGAGKSVCLNTIICSLLYRQRPDRIRLLMVDPKRVELSIYSDIPHLISPVICEPKAAAAALAWAVEQMEERYKTLVDFKVRNIDGYNEIASDPDRQGRFKGRTVPPMPHMVVVVDELADLMVVAKNEVEESIQRLAQMARAVGIHLILATQRPSVNVITGIIKANFPTRIAFQVRQKVDSRTILDQGGAEALLGRGDMLFAPAGAGKPIRIQGSFLSDDEVERIVEHCKENGEPMYEVEEFQPILSEKEQKELARLMGAPEDFDDLDAQDRVVRGTNKTMGKVNAGLFVPHDGGSAGSGDEDIDEALVRAAARVILEGRKGSTSLVQRRLKVGFARAGRLMDMLEEMGIVGPYKGSKPRDLLVDPDSALDQLDLLESQMAASGADSRAAAMALDTGNEGHEDDF